jgi:rhomboid protease GluP
MAHGSRVCPACGRLNAADDTTCSNCKKRMPGPVEQSLGGWLGHLAADGFPMTKLLAFMCFVVYAGCMLSEGAFSFSVAVSGAFKPSTLLRFGVLVGDLGVQEPWRLLSAVFLHLGLLHIGMNMLSLVNLGRSLEPHFGSARFLILYVVTGILGFAASQWWYGYSPPTAGASGAIFGLIGAFVGVLWARKNPNWMRALFNYLAYAAILSFMLPVNTAAHVGGFLAGVVVGALFEKEPQPRRRDGVMRAVAGLCLMACVGSFVLSARSPVWKQQRQAEEKRAERAERLRLNSE